jgi:type II secretory pathway component GspD/PulD (secretin)
MALLAATERTKTSRVGSNAVLALALASAWDGLERNRVPSERPPRHSAKGLQEGMDGMYLCPTVMLHHSITEKTTRLRPAIVVLFLFLFSGAPFCFCAQDPSAASVPASQGIAGSAASNPPAVMLAAEPGGLLLAQRVQRPPQRRLRPEDVTGEIEEEAQETGSQAPPPGPQLPVSRGPVGRAAVAPTGGQFSFNFDDADIFSVIQTVFGDVLKVNYVIDPRVKGRVTFRSVAPVPKENVLPLMEVILRLNGIAAVEESGLFRLVPLSDAAREPSPVGFGRDPEKVPSTGTALLQVIPINYMSSTEVVKLITPFLSTNAVVVDVPKINTIIVVDTDAKVKRILSLVDVFDSEQQKKKRPQVFVYPVQNGKAKDITALLQQIFLGARPSTPAAQTGTTVTSPTMTSPTMTPAVPTPLTPQFQIPGAAGGASALISPEVTRIFSSDVTNSIVALATPEDYEIIKETIQKIDIVPRQVLIEALVAEINLTDNLSLGVAWAIKTNIGGTLDGLISSTGNNLVGITDPTKPSGTAFTFIGTDDRGMVRALVTALTNESRNKLLASPHILVSDNREARIQVGQQVPLVTGETYATPGVAPIQTVQYKDVGIILKVKPQVNESGLVSLEMSQEVSTANLTQVLTTSSQYVINKTEATSSLVVQDGQTIVIGGLIREDTSKTLTGIPYLSKIPIIGYLFGSRGRDITRVEIIILLKPRVIKNPQDARGATSDFVDSFTERGSVTKEELHWLKPLQPSMEGQSTPGQSTPEKDSGEKGK